MNPSREIVRAGLSWSGIGTKNFHIEIYQKNDKKPIYNPEGSIMSIIQNAALHSMYGSMINWISL